MTRKIRGQPVVVGRTDWLATHGHHELARDVARGTPIVVGR
jgi:hypothetical protein